MHFGYLGSGFVTQDHEVSEGAMAAPWSGGHDAGHLSLLV